MIKTGRKYTTAEWVELAKEKHPNVIYDKVDYVGKDKPVVIGCPKHGYFSIIPRYFLSKDEPCALCKKEKDNMDKTKEYVKQIENIWNVYEYEILNKNELVTNRCYVDANCKQHGKFKSLLNNILSYKTICPKCAIDNNANKRRSNINDLIIKFNEVHNGKYDYGQIINYRNYDSKLPILCKEHGIFYQSAHNHLRGQGCPICGRERANKNESISKDEFIKRANLKHNSHYEYNLENYKNGDSIISIICPKHGEFYQKAYKHLIGNGCPKCNRSKLEILINSFLNENNINFEEQKRFDWLGKQSLDFYLPDYNIGIECQGVYHFETQRGVSEEKVANTKERDKIKKEKCKENNLKLIYFLNPIFEKYMRDNDLYFVSLESLKKYLDDSK